MVGQYIPGEAQMIPHFKWGMCSRIWIRGGHVAVLGGILQKARGICLNISSISTQLGGQAEIEAISLAKSPSVVSLLLDSPWSRISFSTSG